MPHLLPFSELVAHKAIRAGFSRGDAMLVLSDDLNSVLWANGAGAALLGAQNISELLGHAPQLNVQTKRQIRSLNLDITGKAQPAALRLTNGLSSALVQCQVTSLDFPEQSTVLLISVKATKPLTDQQLISGFDLPKQHAAILDNDGSVVQATPGFDQLSLLPTTLADLVVEAANSDDGMVQRRIRVASHTLPATIIQLFASQCAGGTPRFILFVSDVLSAPAPQQDDLNADEDNSTDTSSTTIEYENTQPDDTTIERPQPETVRFIWQMDQSLHFTEVSCELAKIVGEQAADIIGQSFSDIANSFKFDSDGSIAELLNRRETWSGQRILWPLAGTDLHVPVDLAALPTYSADRSFCGFNGFGVILPQQATKDPAAVGLTLLPSVNESGSEINVTDQEPVIVPSSEKIILMEALRASQRRKKQQDEEMSASSDTATDTLHLTNDTAPVTLEKNAAEHSSAARPENGLSQTERNAFREIAERLRRDVLQSGKFNNQRESSNDDANISVAENSPPVVQALNQTTNQTNSNITADQTKSAPMLAPRVVEPVPYPHASEAANINASTDRKVSVHSAHEPAQNDDDLHMLSGLPVPVLIHSADRLHFANQAFFDMTGYGSLDGLQDAGGIDALFAPAHSDDSVNGMILCLADGGHKVVEAHLQSVPWQGARALMLSILPEVVLRADNDDRNDLPSLRPVPNTQNNPVHSLQSTLSQQSALSQNAQPVSRATDLPSGAQPDVTPKQSLLPLEQKHSALVQAPTPIQSSPAGRASEAGISASALSDIRQLQTQIDELTSILDTATDGVVIIEHNGKIRSFNQSAAALFGYNCSEVAGKSFAMLFAIESQRAAMDYIHGLSGDGVASLLNDGREVIGREAQGRFIPIFMTIGKLPGSRGFCAVLRDITQWKRAEEELTSARQEAERASHQKTEFLARISHEIRTPLNAIIGFSELMADEKFGAIGNDRYREYLRDINRSGNHVLALVNDLLDISKIEAGGLDLNFESVALNDALAEAVAMMQPQANRERVIIRSSFPAEMPDIVADARSIRQVALNLLSNAIRFTGQGGQVIVSTAYEADGQVIMRIRDTGIGMSQSELEQALKPFQQINTRHQPFAANTQAYSNGLNSRSQGTGLGLPLTKAMVEANRAQFTIESNPGQGTVVEVTFPSTRVLAD